MYRRWLILLTLSLVLALSPLMVSANPVSHDLEQNPVIISEIYPNAVGSSESGNEYIELHNTTDSAVDLTGFSLSREGTTTTSALDGLFIEATGYIVIYPTFSLLNNGSTVFLNHPILPDQKPIEQAVTYPSLDEQHSWSLIGDVWQAEPPTPGLANPIPPIPPVPPNNEPEEPPTNDGQPNTPICNPTTIFINEILANPAGADTTGGEFVELYNGGNEPVNLAGCLLTTDKATNLPLPAVDILPDGYFAFDLIDDLLNSGGSVIFITNDDEFEVVYPKLGDDQSWAVIDGVWQLTNRPTPGSQNLANIEEPKPVVVQTNKDCPPGKFRNPETNRCKNIVSTASTLLPCGPGQARNPLTNRCRSTSSSTSTLTPCKAGQERNPDTNRCRSIASTTAKSLVPCQPGYERNPDTNRCRKVNAVLATANFPEVGPSELNNGVLVFMTIIALGYAGLEYRLDFANWWQKLKDKKLAKA
jgi:hypothetical protein